MGGDNTVPWLAPVSRCSAGRDVVYAQLSQTWGSWQQGATGSAGATEPGCVTPEPGFIYRAASLNTAKNKICSAACSVREQ